MTNTQLEAWVEALATELEVDTGVVDIDRLLDAAREAAHAVSRPAAPLTTFLMGYAVGRASVGEEGPDEGAAAEAFDDARYAARRISDSWTQEMPG
ncbi:DUF6457 domain-containing protein [Demequina flava]|uniref:DUF6457 domain-containing protein n=1 Tax=Demequina flava TaxID=1095025 RepID=UPI0007841B16|nr:DUF6457 domain-containing protein [Demequina flava]